MNRLAPWMLAAVALAGCAKNTSRPTAKMNGPQGVAVYNGYGADQPGVLRPLVAVANTRGDDLRIIDAVTNQVLIGPTMVSALAVPTEPRPSLIAAGSLHDQSPAGTNVLKADLLVVAPRGQVPRPPPAPAGTLGAVIQMVVTWDEKTRVHPAAIDLGDLLPDAVLTGLAVAPVPESDGNGGWRPTAGQARVLATTTDGALVTVLATRDPADTTNAIVLAAPEVQLLGFTGLDLALSPDGTRIYVATLDPIPGPGGILGVAEIDNTAPPGSRPAPRALSARLGTTQVAALDVAPFLDNQTDNPELDTFGPPEPRVYAVLDPGGCGRDRSMPCGIAVIDPMAGTLAPDPSGELPYQLPIQVPGEVADFAVSGPPQVTDKTGFLKFDPGSGLRWTQSFAGVATSAGRVFLVDLSHYSVGNVLSPIMGSSQTRVLSSASYLPDPDSAAIGIWFTPIPSEGNPSPIPTLEFDSLALLGIAVTPGYTGTENFSITYQGTLPGLSNRRAVAHVDAGAPSWIAIQEATNLTAPGTSAWRSVARLYDPRLAVQVGDLVALGGFPSGVCPDGVFEMTVTAILPPDPVLYPGGAVAVQAPTSPPSSSTTCLPQGADTPVSVTFRTPSLVLVGSASGYAGRPRIVLGSPETSPRFEFKYVDEQLLSCPIMPDDPEAWPPSAADIAACQGTDDGARCRATCERLVLARRARRAFYMTDGCLATTTSSGKACNDRWVKAYGLSFPMPTGPVVAFQVGITDPEQGLTLHRDTFLQFNTASGFVPGSRGPTSATGSSSPHGVAIFDRSAVTGVANDALHGYAAFSDNMVLDFAPWSNVAPSTTIR